MADGDGSKWNGGSGSAIGQGSVPSKNTTVTPTSSATKSPTVKVPRPWSDVFVDTSTPQGVAGASDYLSNTWQNPMAASDAEDALLGYLTGDDRIHTNLLTQAIAKAMGHNKTAQGVWEDAIEASKASSSAGSPKSPAEILVAMGQEYGVYGGGTGGKPKGGGGYGGVTSRTDTRTDYQNAPAPDVRDLMDAISMEMLGRGVTQKEATRILAKVRSYENSNPSTSTVSTSGSTTGSKKNSSVATSTTSRSSGGATNAGRQDVIERILAQNPEYGDYQKATTMIGWFDAALNDRLGEYQRSESLGPDL